MLWRTCVTARNIHGELALLCLLVFYDGPMQFIDTGFQFPELQDSEVKEIIQLADKSVITDAEISKIIQNPTLYTPQLLKKARLLFPHNALWVLQEGRMLAAQGKIEKALEIMQNFTDNENNEIRMEQVEALLTFDRGMLYSFVHDYDSAARDFVRMLDISSWSPSVYIFLAGACYTEKWRMIQSDIIQYASETEKKENLHFYAEKAEHYLKLAQTYVPGHGKNASKKGGIGGANKQMPFDKFVLRKSKQIDERQLKYKNLKYIECVGTSLIHELIYFWNGYSRMPEKDLQLLYQLLGYSTQEFAQVEETMDESMIRNFFQSVALRRLGKVSQATKIMEREVIAKFVTQDSPNVPIKFTKMVYSPYLYPTSVYERAVLTWESKYKEDRNGAVSESVKWLKKAEIVSDVGDYELSNRTSMKIKAAKERLEQVKYDV